MFMENKICSSFVRPEGQNFVYKKTSTGHFKYSCSFTVAYKHKNVRNQFLLMHELGLFPNSRK